MPPPESHLSLSDEEKALITKWIEQGAEWKKHWAFIPPQKSEIPDSKFQASNPIDHFIHQKLIEKNLIPSPEADRKRLIRRLSFDLRGLPPTESEIDDFINDQSPDAYEKLVDRFMETDAHAERLAMEWMDVARYADSHGLHADGIREQWPWRDWVIKAFKENLPYDEFITWQIAGDLIPDASREQKLATGFHRNHPTNSEFGIVSEEFRLKYVEDRTSTTATAFMGLTMECATCHDHKFDPISQKEFYQMSAFFNNVHELGMIGNDRNFGPLLMLPGPEEEKRLNELSAQIDKVEAKIKLTQSDVNAIEGYLKLIETKGLHPPEPDGIYPFNSLIKKKNQKGRITLLLDNNPKSTANGDPEIVEGKIGNAVRLDNDYDQVYLKEVGVFNLYEPFSTGGWFSVEKEKGFKTMIDNNSGKNAGWRGWIFFLDSLNRPGVKIIHNHAHNYIHVLAEESVNTKVWTHVFFTYDGSTKAEGIQIYINGQPIKQKTLFDNLYKSTLQVRGRGYYPAPDKPIRLGRGR